MDILKKKNSIILYQEGEQFGIKDLETNQDICEKSPLIQLVKEEFEHYWRRKNRLIRNNAVFENDKGFFNWDSVENYD